MPVYCVCGFIYLLEYLLCGFIKLHEWILHLLPLVVCYKKCIKWLRTFILVQSAWYCLDVPLVNHFIDAPQC